MMQDARERGVRVACPRVVGKTLQFHEWQAGDSTETTIGGVLQPKDSGSVIPAEDIDLFLTPLLGVGEHGIRLGYGGGFYDRLFAAVGGFRLGVGFAVQQVDRWEIEAHDQQLDAFLSEEGMTVFT
jgi:5-formyltetrahydrofolate cyclo-ligase